MMRPRAPGGQNNSCGAVTVSGGRGVTAGDMQATFKLLLLPALLLSACKDGDGEASDGSSSGDTTAGETGETGEVAARTYWQDVAPIYYDRCVACHQAGGIAPFALDNAEDAGKWAAASAAAVQDRTMPPWLMTSDGSCGEFRGSRALAEEEIATIVHWAAEGAAPGSARDDLKPPPLPGLGDGLTLRTPEFSPSPVGGPLAEFDEYRCFMVDPKLDHDQFLTGYEVTPGNAPLVHHVLAMPVDLDALGYDGMTRNGDLIAALDAESPDRDGWPCFSAAGDGVANDGLPVTWAPGMGAVEYPDDTGVRVPAGRQIVIQIHYNLHDPALEGQSDSSAVKLRFVDEVAREGYFDVIDPFIDTLFEGEPDALAPGKASEKYTWTVDVGKYAVPPGAEQVEVYGLFPHMHERGHKWRATLLDGDEEQCIGDVQHWDFDWQLYYFYEQPKIVRPGTRLRVTCDFDTRDAKEPVTPGWGTQNEMCLAGVYVVP